MAEEKIGKYAEQVVKLNDLELDLKNPRTGEHPDQSSAINAMLHRKSTDIDEMADGIVRNGFLTLELPCVYPSSKKGKFIVAEGNRRVTALKVLHTPDLAHGSKKYEKFKKLSQEAGGKLPKEIRCAVFKNAKECLPYVLMRHGLGGDGASLKVWDALERRRVHEIISGTSHQALNVINFILDQGNLSAAHEEKLASIKITNLERLTDSAVVRKILEVQKTDCTKSTKGEAWLLPVWQKIIEIMLDEKYQGNPFTVKDIYNASDQERFIRQILYDVHKTPILASPSGGGATRGSGSASGGAGGSSTGAEKSKKGKPGGAAKPSQGTTRQRKGLIAKNFSPSKLSPQKIVNLVEELKQIDAEKFENCSGVMFRVFIELTIRHYMAKAKLKRVDNNGEELTEKAKRQAVIKHLKGTGKYDKKSFKALEDTLHNNHPLSAQTLNHYVHSSTHSPSGSTLKTEWDNLQHILEIIWEA